MEPPNGHPCPECGAPRRPDHTPSCACTHRASEALRDARTAEAAAAEDFDPLRIRPYVEIDTAAPSGPGTRAGDEEAARRQPPSTTADTPGTRPGTDASRTEPGAPPRLQTEPTTPSRTPEETPRRGLGGAPAAPQEREKPARPTEGTPRDPHLNTPAAPAPADASPAGSAAQGRPSPSAADATMPLRPVAPDATTVLPAAPATSVMPTPLAPGAAEPSVSDLRLFDGGGRDRRTAEPGEPGPRPGRRRRAVLLAAAGACVAVVTAAGYASGLFSYESPSRDTALPDDIRASVPDAPSSSAASTPPEASASAPPSAPAAPPPSPSRTGSPSPSSSPSAPSASPSPSGSASPSAPPTSATASAPGRTSPDDRRIDGPAVLRRGDRGPQVAELQQRLRQVYLYDEDADGSFDDRLEEAVRTYQWSRGIRTDDLGVYDEETRERLESETREP
ncbi:MULTISPECIES: peptidoglycan-binding protein [unclassified Streptomyces]|uniref:peptidoglycan-binding domain-containing protein n=1 Tax=unclassified Streptomyces TaxID=2593676 RepID=UPI0033B8B1E7